MSGDGLGDYLRARRADVSPTQAGLTSHGLRRVSGLRREEVALLSDVSVDYYTRLEQGRERRPSPQVIDALATVLQLPDDARKYMFRLAGLSPHERGDVGTRVDPALLDLLDMWTVTPALVYNRAFDVLAGNWIAHAMFLEWTTTKNLMHRIFTEPAARSFFATGRMSRRRRLRASGTGSGWRLRTCACTQCETSCSKAVPILQLCGRATLSDEDHCGKSGFVTPGSVLCL